MTTTAAATELASRVGSLVSHFRAVNAGPMADFPLRHPGLRVEAVGFQRQHDGTLGVLITPWFMNLVWLPDSPTPRVRPDAPAPGAGAAADQPALPVGASRYRCLGPELAHRLEFIGAHADPVGPYETCSMFSPMDEFADHAAAVATASAVLDLLRAPPVEAVVGRSASSPSPSPSPSQAPARSATAAAPTPARRRFLFGGHAA